VSVRIAPVESCRISLPMVSVLVPCARAAKSNSISVPLRETPEIALSSVSALKAIMPALLSIIPGMRNVDPPLGKNDPSVMPVADNTDGSKSRSSWKS
jgi:hypothetical protein